ncbi:MAG TPA: hypothetical protein VGX71_17795 [Pseudaminobacter sp.]|nr:hypothetical protein [Pseudaminobacter sp.]
MIDTVNVSDSVREDELRHAPQIDEIPTDRIAICVDDSGDSGGFVVFGDGEVDEVEKPERE